jgi:HAD superfamily hydrolase (TIGR01490 family)
VALALFDLDNTLLAGDSDYLWGRFLVECGIVDGDYYERENQRFYDDYRAGRLDIHEFLAFSLAPLAAHPRSQLEHWHADFMRQAILPILLPQAFELLDNHRQRGDTLVIITATNRFVTAPIAETLGVDTLLATEPEEQNGQFTGRVAGTPCFRDGKLVRLQQWMAEQGHTLADSWFYSDSHNDLPLLEAVTFPVAVDADPILANHATLRGWPQLSLR